MIDTIILRIHNIAKYDQIYQQYWNPIEERNTFSKVLVNKDTGELSEHDFVSRMVFHDTNRVLPVTARGNNNIASSHYSLSYNFNPSQDFLEFNFSIPKYLYAQNVMQFVNIYGQYPSIMWGHFIMFIRKFLRENFIQIPLDEDIEINRIDFCYNQFFNNKADALMYLDEQKKLVETYARSSKNSFRTYATSLMYVTQNYSFKIYHKGTEFERHDYKELQKRNKQNHDLKALYEHSQCILRYEMTFRCKMLNYLATHNFMNSKSENYNAYTSHPVSKFYRRLKMSGAKPLADKFKNKTKRLFLKSLFNATNDLDILMHESAITFDEQIFTFCYNAFHKKIEQYTVGKSQNSGEIIHSQIAKHVKEQKQNQKIIRKSKDDAWGTNTSTLLLGALLMQHMNLDEIRQFMPKTTLWRLKRDLTRMGIGFKKVAYNLPSPRTDYVDYFIYFLSSHHKLDPVCI